MTAVDVDQDFRVEFATLAGDVLATDYLTATGYDAAAERAQRAALAIPGAEWLEVYQRDREDPKAAEYVGGWEAPAAECGRCAELLFPTPTGLYDRRGRQACGTGTVRHEPAPAPALGRYEDAEDVRLSAVDLPDGGVLVSVGTGAGKASAARALVTQAIEMGARLYVVDCPACWFSGGAPVAGEVEAVQLAATHDDRTHGGQPTAVIRSGAAAGGEVR